MAVETAPGEVVLRASADGHFYANATVDGVAVRFLVDTGASSITLSAADARRVGFDPEALDYFLPVTTASGAALAARVTLDEVRLGSIALSRRDGRRDAPRYARSLAPRHVVSGPAVGVRDRGRSAGPAPLSFVGAEPERRAGAPAGLSVRS